jgi:antitoxin (DNA-binding transcriptional repressor) of toxin-antitoxin stability system
MMRAVAAFRISEADAARDFASLMARVRAGAEVIIESGASPVAVVRTPAQPARTFEEARALLPEDSSARMDEEFARDVEMAIASQRESLNPPSWE